MHKLVYITLLALVGLAMAQSPVIITAPLNYTSVGVIWSPQTLPIDHYVVRFFTKTGLNDSVVVADTSARIFFPKMFMQDSIFAEVRAVDSLGQSSGYSVRVGAIPQVVHMDYHPDSLKRIDVRDYQALYKLYKATFGKTLYKEVAK